MNYGVVVSSDSFVFTRQGVSSVKKLTIDSEVLGVHGIGKHIEFKKVNLYHEEKTVRGIRLISQATDSVLLPDTTIFSERIQKAEDFCSAAEIEFYYPPKSPKFKPCSKKKAIDLYPDTAYGIGLITNIVDKRDRCMAFLIRNVDDPEYEKQIKQTINNLATRISGKDLLKTRFVKGKMGHFWIIFKGNVAEKIQTIMHDFSTEEICMRLNSKQLENFVAGVLDSYINKPLYGGDPVLTFSIENSVAKRFLHNVLILYDSQIVETSCITSHAPKLLESTGTIEKEIPIRNPTWNDLLDVPEKPRLFSRIRGWLEVPTSSTKLLFEEEGFSPVVDGLYTYPSVITN